MLIPEAYLSGLLFGSEAEFGVEPGNGKSYSNGIKNQSQFVLITRASIFPLFPKEQVREETKWIGGGKKGRKKKSKKRQRRESLQNSFTYKYQKEANISSSNNLHVHINIFTFFSL